jgi:hypothetical protein
MQCDFHLILFRLDGVVREMLKIVLHKRFLGYMLMRNFLRFPPTISFLHILCTIKKTATSSYL